MNYRLFIGILLLAGFMSCHSSKKGNAPEKEGTPETNVMVDPVKVYSDSIAMDSTRSDLYLMRAKGYLANEQVSAAMIDVNKAISLKPNQVDPYMLLADIYYMLGDEANISNALTRATEIDPMDARPLVKLGELNLLQQNFNLSAAYIDKALKINPYNPQAYFLKGMYFMVATQDTASAVKNFQYAYEQDNRFYDPVEQICRIYAVQEPPYALDYIRSVQKNFPDNANARYELALYLQEHGEPEEALKHYDTLLMAQPENPIVLYNMGYTNFVYLRNNEVALKYFEEALSVNPDYLDALFNRGRVLEQMGNYHDASEVYKEVLKRRPNYQLAIDAVNRIQNQAEE